MDKTRTVAYMVAINKALAMALARAKADCADAESDAMRDSDATDVGYGTRTCARSLADAE